MIAGYCFCEKLKRYMCPLIWGFVSKTFTVSFLHYKSQKNLTVQRKTFDMLSKTTKYSIRSLVYIYMQNVKGERPGFREIAQNIDSPREFTGKVLQTITRSGLISSVKGRGGGFFFEDLEKPLKLLDIMEVTDGQDFFHKCGFGLESCNAENPCPMHDEYAKVRDAFYDLMNNLTIQSLAQKINQNKAVLNRLEIS